MKKILSCLIGFYLLLNSGALAVGIGVDYDAGNKTIFISGNAGTINAGKDITCLIIKKDADLNNVHLEDIANMSQTIVSSSGAYEFNLKFMGNADDYMLMVNQAGKNISSTVTNAGVTEKNDYYVYDDFEDFDTGVVNADNPYGWIIDTGDGRDYVGIGDIKDADTDAAAASWYFVKGQNDNIEIADVENEKGCLTKALKITFDPSDNNSSRTFDILRKFIYTPGTGDKIKISFKYKIDNPQAANKGLGSWYWGNVYYGNNSQIVTNGINVCYDQDWNGIRTSYSLNDGTTEAILVQKVDKDTFDAGYWHEMEYYADFGAKTLEYYADNHIKSKKSFTDEIDMAKNLAWKINKGYAEVPCSFYIDDVKVEKLKDFALEKYFVTDSINLQFTYPVSVEEAIYGITVKENGVQLKPSELNISAQSDNSIILVPKGGIKSHACYEISIKDDMVDNHNYRTIIKKYDMAVYSEYSKPYINRDSITKSESEISFSVNNPTGEIKNLWCIAISTDETNAITSMGSAKIYDLSDTANCSINLNNITGAANLYLVDFYTMELYDKAVK